MVTSTAAGLQPIRAHLLGEVRLAVGDRPLAERAWTRRTARSLLLLLLATPGHRLPRDRVLDLLWPESPPASARNALYLALSELRRVVAPERARGRAATHVEIGVDTVALREDAGLWVDVDAFETALAHATTASPPDRVAALEEALALYGGDLLAHETGVEWAEARRERLRRGRRRAVLDLADLAISAGRPLAAIPELERLLANDPIDEAAHRALMRTLAAAGRRDEARRQYDRCVQALRDGLGAEPDEETRALGASLQTATERSRGGVAANRAGRFDNLPTPPNPLVGRRREVEALQDLLLDPAARLVTVTGPGGIGKTRLALEAATHLAEDFADGACFVGLAAIREPGLVVSTIARALGIEEGKAGADALEERVQTLLRGRDLLLVVDNFEQVLAAAPVVTRLLEGCPRLTVLTTSRAALRLPMEHVFAVPPLTLPDETDGDRRPTAPRLVERAEAVELFRQRAAALRPGFAVTTANAAAVAAVCRRLDGLPLAIELAAARSRTLTPAGLLAGLDDRFEVLAEGFRDLPPRQRTMRAAIAWSHDLLSDEDRRLFQRLAVFQGGATVDAATAVVAGMRTDEQPHASSLIPHPSVADGLASLADHNLVRWDDDHASRLTMLETIREYGLEQLRASGEEPAIRRAHAAHFLALAERTDGAPAGTDRTEQFERLAADHDNLRAAMDWCLAHGDAERALRIATGVHEFWLMRGHITEGRDRLARALTDDAGVPTAVRAAGYSAAASLASAQDDIARSEGFHRAALALRREIGDTGGVARSLKGIGAMRRRQGDFDGATPILEEALRLSRAHGDRETAAAALNELGNAAYRQGDRPAAEARYREALACYQDLGNPEGAGHVLNNLCMLARDRGDLAAGRRLTEEALALFRACGDTFGVAAALSNLGGLAILLDDPAGALPILAEGVRVAHEHGHRHYLAVALFNQADALRRLGRAPEAFPLWAESLSVLLAFGDRATVADAADELADALATLGRPAQAVRLWSAAQAYREHLGIPRPLVDPDAADHPLRHAREALGAASFAAALDIGQRTAIAQAVAEALAE